MTEHRLKTWPMFYDRIISGEKTFEVRRKDRDFKVGDILILQEWNPENQSYTTREFKVKVKYILEGYNLGIRVDFCVMSITEDKP